MFQITYWKRHPDQHASLVACDKDDPDACRFDVSYPGMMYSSSTVEFDSKFEAESFVHVLHRVYNAGRQASRRELKRWLDGVDFT